MLLLSRLKTKVIFDFQEELIRRTFLVSFSSLILVLTLPLGGCTKPKATIQGNINCGGGKPCTYGGSASMTFAVHAEEVSPADLNIALATGYAVVVSVPSNELALDPEELLAAHRRRARHSTPRPEHESGSCRPPATSLPPRPVALGRIGSTA